MKRKIKVVCIVVGFLGLLSAALGFAAEAKKIKGSQVQSTSPDCVYPRSPAVALGLTAALTLMTAKIIINVATGCVCCKRGPHESDSNWTLALVCCVVSWFTFVIAFLLLLTGAAFNEPTLHFGQHNCYVLKPGIFAGAAVLSLASVGLGILYFFTFTKTKNRNDPWAGPSAPNQAGIAMGQPQFPPQNSQDHVFVREDTYVRRQFT